MNGLTSERGESIFRVGFGVADLLSAVIVYVAVFQGLPARYWPVDAAAAIVLGLFAAAGAGLFWQASWAPKVAWVASAISLALGLLLVATLALTAGFLSGIYGPVGRGGSLILGLAAALALPYLVVIPAAQLVWLGPFRATRTMAPEATAPQATSGS